MNLFFMNLLNGISLGMLLFLISIGLTIIFGVLGVLNFAHGSLYMIGAFLTYSIATFCGQSAFGFWLALLLAPLGVALLSLVFERLLISHLYEREHLMLLLFTFSFALVCGDLVKLIWGSDYRSLSAPLFLQGYFLIAGFPFPRYNLFLLLLGPLVAAGLWLLTNKTRIGKIARAAAVDREMVGAIGINVSWVFAAVFVIGCYLAGLGGALVAPTQNIVQGMDHAIIIEAFLIVIIGGLGNIWGALLGGMTLGLVESYGAIAIGPEYNEAIGLAVMVLVLVLRPRGLIGRKYWNV